MHSLVQSLPVDQVESTVACLRSENLDQFRVSRLWTQKHNDKIAWGINGLLRRIGRPNVQIPYVRKAVRALRPQLVHSHFGDVGVRDSHALQTVDVKRAVTFYGYDLSELPQQQPSILEDYRQLFATVSGVLCEGPFMADRVVDMGCPREKVHVQHLGVDLEKIEFQPRSWSPGRTLKVLIAGSFREKKGIPYAIRALGQVARSTDVQITVVGDSYRSQSSQDEKTKILQAIEESGLVAQTKLLGFQPYATLKRLSREHHLFVSPSVQAESGDNEGGAPVTLIEMAASGMPIISSFHCDIPNVIVDGETGWLAEERNVDAITGRIEDAIASHDRWGGILAAGRKRMEAEFDVVKQGQRLAQIYRAIVE